MMDRKQVIIASLMGISILLAGVIFLSHELKSSERQGLTTLGVYELGLSPVYSQSVADATLSLSDEQRQETRDRLQSIALGR